MSLPGNAVRPGMSFWVDYLHQDQATPLGPGTYPGEMMYRVPGKRRPMLAISWPSGSRFRALKFTGQRPKRNNPLAFKEFRGAGKKEVTYLLLDEMHSCELALCADKRPSELDFDRLTMDAIMTLLRDNVMRQLR